MKQKEYRITEGYGNYFNKRWEVQEKYFYCDSNGEMIKSWHTVYHSTNKNDCLEVLEKYKTKPPKDYRIPFEDAMTLWQ